MIVDESLKEKLKCLVLSLLYHALIAILNPLHGNMSLSRLFEQAKKINLDLK